ncbi:hypothetical protein Dimus_022241, partial [Dionaea muscipula]
FQSKGKAMVVVQGIRDFCVREHWLKVELASFDRPPTVFHRQKGKELYSSRMDPTKDKVFKGNMGQKRWIPT